MASTDITSPVDLFVHAEGTGPKRQRRPEYVDFMPPCNSACPAGENIQAWLSLAQEGKYLEAFRKLVEENPFPATLGRICVKPCETGCNRNHIDKTVNIHAVERFLGDEALRLDWSVPENVELTGFKVMVIGAGPSGLSAAYQLARMGHKVHVYEAAPLPGGLLQYGIPEYRLGHRIVQQEIERIQKLGVEIHCGIKVDDLMGLKAKEGFHAVYVAIGAQLIAPEVFETDHSVEVSDAFSFLRTASTEHRDFSQKRFLIYGGGKLALYLARAVKRLGGQATVYYAGDKKMMPAYDYETEDAIEEGVNVNLLRSIRGISKGIATLEEMKAEKGKSIGTGNFEQAPLDFLILANRQESATEFLRSVAPIKINPDGTVVIDGSRMTGQEGVFAGGDLLPGENRSATIAIGQGKKAAKYVDAYLRQIPFQKPEKHPTAGFRKLHMWYRTDAPMKQQSKLTPQEAVQSFEEIAQGLAEPEARFEAQRCLSCGNCFECDGCFGACPVDAIIKLGKGNRYKFNYDICTGCAVCFEQCPCHAIEMIAEPMEQSDVKAK